MISLKIHILAMPIIIVSENSSLCVVNGDILVFKVRPENSLSLKMSMKSVNIHSFFYQFQ